MQFDDAEAALRAILTHRGERRCQDIEGYCFWCRSPIDSPAWNRETDEPDYTRTKGHEPGCIFVAAAALLDRLDAEVGPT